MNTTEIIIDVQIKEEVIEDPEDNIDDDTNVLHIEPIVKIENIKEEYTDTTDYNIDNIEANKLNIGPEHSIPETEDGLHRDYSIPSTELRHNWFQKPVNYELNKTYSDTAKTSDQVAKKLAAAKQTIQKTSRNPETDGIFEEYNEPNKIKVVYKSKEENKLNNFNAVSAEKPYICFVCEKRFGDKAKLRIHGRIHTGEKPYKCNVCEKRFTQRQHLKHHIRIHTGESPYKCDVCEKCFKQHSSLTKHNRIHTGEKPFKCNLCEKSFSESGTLTNHIRSIHTNERPHKCDVCHKCFVRRVNLMNHILTHTGERSFKCDICGKGFRLKKHLKYHITHIHSDKKRKKRSI